MTENVQSPNRNSGENIDGNSNAISSKSNAISSKSNMISSKSIEKTIEKSAEKCYDNIAVNKADSLKGEQPMNRREAETSKRETKVTKRDYVKISDRMIR